MKLAIFEEFKDKVYSCDKCGLGENKSHVIGDGNLDAKIMFIAEASGQNEVIHKQVLTPTGKSGKQFAGILEKLGLKREEVYTCNLIVCHTPDNRDPTRYEIQECSGFVEQQINLIKPKLIVCFGRFSSMYFLGDDFKITKDHGRLFKNEKFNVDIFSIFHPAYVSSYCSQTKRQEFKNDLNTLKNIINNM